MLDDVSAMEEIQKRKMCGKPMALHQEYIITEPVFNHVVAALRDNRQYDVAEYLIAGSRHHTPAPAPEFTDAENKWCDDYAAAYNRGFDAGAKAEREKVLQDLLYNIDSETGFYVFPHPKSNAGNGLSRFVLLDDMTTLVESLRSTQQQAGEQHE